MTIIEILEIEYKDDHFIIQATTDGPGVSVFHYYIDKQDYLKDVGYDVSHFLNGYYVEFTDENYNPITDTYPIVSSIPVEDIDLSEIEDEADMIAYCNSKQDQWELIETHD